MLNLETVVNDKVSDENSITEHVLGKVGKAAPVKAMQLPSIDEFAWTFENDDATTYEGIEQHLGGEYIVSSTGAEKQKNSKPRSLAKRLRRLRTFRKNDTKKPANEKKPVKEKEQPKEKENKKSTKRSNNIVKATATTPQPVKTTGIIQADPSNRASPEKEVDNSIDRPENSDLRPVELVLQDWLNRSESPEKKKEKNDLHVYGRIKQPTEWQRRIDRMHLPTGQSILSEEETTAKTALRILNEENTKSTAETPTCIAEENTVSATDVAPVKIISAFGSNDENGIMKEFPPTTGSDENKLNAESNHSPEVKIENVFADTLGENDAFQQEQEPEKKAKNDFHVYGRINQLTKWQRRIDRMYLPTGQSILLEEESTAKAAVRILNEENTKSAAVTPTCIAEENTVSATDVAPVKIISAFGSNDEDKIVKPFVDTLEFPPIASSGENKLNAESNHSPEVKIEDVFADTLGENNAFQRVQEPEWEATPKPFEPVFKKTQAEPSVVGKKVSTAEKRRQRYYSSMTAAAIEEPEPMISSLSETKADPCIASIAETSELPNASSEDEKQISVESRPSTRITVCNLLADVCESDPSNQSEGDGILPLELVGTFGSVDDENGPPKTGEIVAELQTSETKAEAEAPVRTQTLTSGKKLPATEKRRRLHNIIIESTNAEERMPIASAGSIGKDDPVKQEAWAWESSVTASTGKSNGVWYKDFLKCGVEDHSMEQSASISETDQIVGAQSLPKDTSTPDRGKTIPLQWNEPQEQAFAKSSEFEDRTEESPYQAPSEFSSVASGDKTAPRHNITNPAEHFSKNLFTPSYNFDSQQTESHDERVAPPKRLFQEANELVTHGPQLQTYAFFDFESVTKENEIVSDKTAWAKNTDEWNNFGDDDAELPKSSCNIFSVPAKWATEITSPTSVTGF